MVHIKKELPTEPIKGHNLWTFQNDDDQKFNPLNLQVEARTANTRAEVPICLMFKVDQQLLFFLLVFVYKIKTLYIQKNGRETCSVLRAAYCPCLRPSPPPTPNLTRQVHITRFNSHDIIMGYMMVFKLPPPTPNLTLGGDHKRFLDHKDFFVFLFLDTFNGCLKVVWFPT